MPSDAARPAAKKLVLIDGNSLLYRGFFAMRALTTSAGQHTNAVFSFTMMLLTLLDDQKPDVILCAWDAPAKTFRHEEFAEYKGQRKAAPSELVEQGPLAREMVGALNVPMIEMPGFEADDVIGTLATRGREQGYEVLIVTGDLDALQLVQPGVRVMTTVKGVTDTVIYDEAAVENRYGLKPIQLTDYRALKGDASDNIPGVPGVGEKTATQVLQAFGTIENLLARMDEVAPAKLQANLAAHTQQMEMSKRLATIVRDVPLDEDVNLPALDADPHAPDWDAVRALFERLEFRTLLRRLPKESDAAPDEAAPAVAAKPAPNLEAFDYDPFAASDEEATPPVDAKAAAPDAPPPDFRDVDPAAPDHLADLAKTIRAANRVAVRLHVSDPAGDLDARLLGVALAPDNAADGTVFYVPTSASPSGELAPAQPAPAQPAVKIASLFDEAFPEPVAGSLAAQNVAVPDVLRELLEAENVAKVTHQAKSDVAILARHGVALRGVAFDTELAAYLLTAGRRSSFPLVEVAADFAGRALSPLDKKTLKGMEAADVEAHQKQETFKEAEAILATMRVQEPRLSAEGLTKILNDLELPLAPILAEMEIAGLAVDVDVLNHMAARLQSDVDGLEKEIHALAGQEFAIGSTKQLQEVLFDKLKIPSGKKTKTGYSTGADVLDELAGEYPIVGKVLSYRELTKLKNTYAEAMPALVRKDGRIHTSLNQTVAATGRLSSSNPNLQNIPVRTAIGREIRRAFVADAGSVLVSADYSQIELRIFAHVTRDPALVDAFSSGEDIHKYTAGKMYNVPVDEVTTDMRRAAKTVNYAVIYGISEFALGRRLGISMAAAKELKTSYFARFPGVRKYLDETVAFAREKGYVQTLFGRRRYIPDISSRVFQFRQAAERAAANMPIQGSSADIMKAAMIRVHDMLKGSDLRATMLLQVHDELLFECPPGEVNALAGRARTEMENAYPLTVALEVEVKTGKTWADVTPVEDMAAPLGVDGPDGLH